MISLKAVVLCLYDLFFTRYTHHDNTPTPEPDWTDGT